MLYQRPSYTYNNEDNEEELRGDCAGGDNGEIWVQRAVRRWMEEKLWWKSWQKGVLWRFQQYGLENQIRGLGWRWYIWGGKVRKSYQVNNHTEVTPPTWRLRQLGSPQWWWEPQCGDCGWRDLVGLMGDPLGDDGVMILCPRGKCEEEIFADDESWTSGS